MGKKILDLPGGAIDLVRTQPGEEGGGGLPQLKTILLLLGRAVKKAKGLRAH